MFGDDNTYNPIIDLAGYREIRQTDNVIPFKESGVRFRKFEHKPFHDVKEGAVIYLAARRMADLGSNYI